MRCPHFDEGSVMRNARGRARLSFLFAATLATLLGGWSLGGSAGQATLAGAPVAMDSAILKSLRWRSIGPDRGGRSITVSGVKGQPKVGYFGATGGGLWKTSD